MKHHTYKEIWKTFKAYAAIKGYTEKVVGDESFTMTRDPQSPQIKLISAKHGTIIVKESLKGDYDIIYVQSTASK
jgi:hypothetical protein